MTVISIDEYTRYSLDFIRSGSREICNPPPENTDEDYLLLMDTHTVKVLENKLKEEGWTNGLFGENSSYYPKHKRKVYTNSLLLNSESNPNWQAVTIKKGMPLNKYHKYIYEVQDIDGNITLLTLNDYYPDGLKLEQNRTLKHIKAWFGDDSLPDLEEYPDFIKCREDKSTVFHSWKKDYLNFILTCSPEYFYNFDKATRMAKFLNLKQKTDRIALFECICFDKWPDYINEVL
jgi:hypothetical protein